MYTRAQLGWDTLYNLDAPISILPDDVLAMIFEEGMHARYSRPQNVSFDFEVRVSHVTRRWRHVSLATPKLWKSIWCIADADGDSPPYPEGRFATMFSRAKSLPLYIHIEGFYAKDFSSSFLWLLSDHCCHLYVDAAPDGLTKTFKYISLQPMPLLESIALQSYESVVQFHEQLFPSGVPCLTTARIVDVDFTTMHHCLPAFSSLISLQLSDIDYPDYSSFREALMALPSLRHLELFVSIFHIPSSPTHLPILLPKLLHLHVRSSINALPYGDSALSDLLSCIQAASLVALALSAWVGDPCSVCVG